MLVSKRNCLKLILYAGGWENIFIILFKGRKSLRKDAWLCAGSTEFVRGGLFYSLSCSGKASCVSFSSFVCAVILSNRHPCEKAP